MALMQTHSTSIFFSLLIYNDAGQAWQSCNWLINSIENEVPDKNFFCSQQLF